MKYLNSWDLDYWKKTIKKQWQYLFKKMEFEFKEQVMHELKFDGKKIGMGYFDFLIEAKIVVELKRGKFFFAAEIDQVSQYLKMSDKKLGLIIRFTNEGARFKRVINEGGGKFLP